MGLTSLLSTENLSRSSGRRPWVVIGAWVVALVVALGLISVLLEDGLTAEFSFTNDAESKRAETLLEERLRGPRQANEIIILSSDAFTVDDPRFREFAQKVLQDVVALDSEITASSVSYYLIGDESLVSEDRQTTIIPISMAGTFDEATTNIEKVREVVHEANEQAGFRALITGEATVAAESNEVAESDLLKGESIGAPVALIILILLFGALLVALLPLVLAIFSILLALGVTALIGQAFSLSFFVTNMIFMIGLAVGIDYSLFIVSRYREERFKGLEKIDAIARAGATASRAVFFSGTTVVLALLGMLIVPTNIFQSLAIGAILVVIAAVLASLTLLPAVLSLMGDKVNSLRVPILGRRLVEKPGDNSFGGFWNWITGVVMKRPVVSLVLAAAILLAAAVPYLDINTGSAGVSSLPDGLASKEGFLILEEKFSFGLVSPALIVIDGDIISGPVRNGIQNLQSFLNDDPAFVGQARMEVNDSGDLALLSAPVAGDTTSETAIEAVRRLRDQYIPQAFSGVDAEVMVTGGTAFNVDFFDIADQYLSIVIALILALSFVLLTLVFRSIVVPIKAIIMNLLSVGAAYGLVVLVSQKGYGAGILGFHRWIL